MGIINFLSLSLSPCDDIAVLKTVLFVKNLLNIVLFLIPIILIVMIMVDLAKNVMASKDDEMNKNFKIAVKRLFFAVALFLVPTIVNFVIYGLGNFDSDYKNCLEVTKESIESQIVENKDRCLEEDGYKWDESTSQCLMEAKVPESFEESTSTKMKINSSAVKNGDLIYYNQGDYKNVKFCGSGKTISSSGCGATSLAIIASSFSDKKYDPKYMAKWLCSNGHVGGALTTEYFTKEKLLNKFNLSVTTLFHKKSKHMGNAGKEYDSKEGKKILNAVKEGKGIVLYIPGHYVAVGPNHKCDSDEVYLYNVGRRGDNGCYTPRQLFKKTYNYKDRCSNNGNCGWKAAWAYTSK